MKKKISYLIAVMVALFSLTSCSKDQILNTYDKVVTSAGELQLTNKKALVGEKSPGEDDYTGEYIAEYKKFTGKEYIFGGTTIDRKAGNEIKVDCNLKIEEGTAKLMFVSGSNEPEVLIEKSGEWSGNIEIPEGGNYLYIEADNYSGKIELCVE